MSFRPAGLVDTSDDEFDDEDGFSLADDKMKPPRSPSPKFETSITSLPQSPPNPSDYDRHLQVLTACMTGDLTTITTFLDSGADINAFLSSGWTLLLYASNALLPEVISHLLKRGANPNTHKDGYSPLMAVCDSPHGQSQQYLNCISILLEAKADPNATSKDRRTALMFASKSGHPEVVLKLLEHVKDIDTVDNDGRSAVFYAVTGNHPEILKLLIANKASVTLKDRRDLTIRDIASTKGFDDILEMLEFDQEEIESFCPVTHISEWRDAFPGIRGTKEEFVNVDVAAVLYAVGLERYRPIFKGMELKEFLQLTDEDLVKLGMDMQYHRKQFLNGLLMFHTRKWSHLSLGSVNRAISHTLYDGITCLGNVARQIGVIGSSFRYIKHNISLIGKAKDTLSDMQDREFKNELQKTEETLGSLKKDLHYMLTFAKKVERDSVVHPPAEYIGPEKRKTMTKWPIFLGATVMAGFYLSKTGYSTRLWN